MGSSSGFGSTSSDSRPIQTCFRCGSGSFLPLPATHRNSSDHTPKGTLLAVLADSAFNCMEANGFRVYFTPLAGVLFTVPSRYCALSVTGCSSPWGVGSPASHHVARVWCYSRIQQRCLSNFIYPTVTVSGAVFQTASTIFTITVLDDSPTFTVLQPQARKACQLGTCLV